LFTIVYTEVIVDYILIAFHFHFHSLFYLQRAGNLCFQGITKDNATALHFSVLVKDSPLVVPEGSSLCWWEDVKELVDSVPERVRSLRLLLRFIQRYHSTVVGWEGSPNLAQMIDWRDSQGLTPLMCASSIGNASAVKLLLEVRELLL
jgi:hypothetical protein